MQYTKQAALSIDMMASKQILNLNQYMKDKYKEYEENKTRDNSYEFDIDADEFEFNEVNIAKESEFECESAEYSDAISMGKDEVELNFAEVGNNCMFRFTKDMQGNIKQYMTLNNNMSQARVISESEYNKFYDNYTKIYGDKAEEKEIEKEVEYEI